MDVTRHDAPGTAPPGTAPLGTALLVAAISSVGAGLVHAAAAGTHSDDTALAWMFALCAVAQIGWAALVVAWPNRATLAVGVILNGGSVVVWALTRTVGLVGPLADVESVGTQDLIAAVLGAAAAGAALVALVGRLRPTTGSPRALRIDLPLLGVATALVLVLVVPAMATTHDHGDGHAHGDEAAAHDHTGTATGTGTAHATHDADRGEASSATPSADGHSHGEAAGGVADVAATGPVVSLDDARLTSAQRARATDLLARTRSAMAAFPDEASIVAAGYTWIGDGRRAGGYQHFVHAEYMRDGRMLDPAHVESIVLQVQPDGITKRVMSAMFIAEPGTTMETVPDIGGELTVWHDHQNLCWDGNRIAGVRVNGVCRPGGTFRPTAPMIHLWLDDPPCGPFTGIEGHGGTNCEHAHTGA